MSYRKCGVRECYRNATSTVPFRGQQLSVCSLCYQTIMAKLDTKLKEHDASHNRLERKKAR